MPEQARLRIHGEGGIDIRFAFQYLYELNVAYSSILALDIVLDALAHDLPYLPEIGGRSFRRSVYFDSGWGRFGPDGPSLRWIPTREEIDAIVPSAERLILAKVNIASPGFWEFLGTLNPLEVTRKYLCDAHERKKDRGYRESAEERRLGLENAALENKVLGERIKLLKDLGATDRDLAPLLNTLLHEPLERLEHHQARGVISFAEIVTSKNDANDISEGPPIEPA